MVWMSPNPSLTISLNILVRSGHLDVGCISCSSGHENAYVRSSLADAIAEGVEHWPQVIQKTVDKLQDFYREKVGLPYVSKSISQLQPRLNYSHQSSTNM
jgi:hypothetical protein